MAEEDNKRMDVAKPGKTPPDSTSRPVIVGHKPLVKQDPMVNGSSDGKTETKEEPITVHTGKVVQPPDAEQDKEEPAADSPKLEDNSETEKKEEQSATEKDSDSKDPATEDSIAEQSDLKKKDQGPSEEEIKKQEEIQKLIEEKKYFIPIKVASHKRNARWSVVVLILIVAMAGVYLWLVRPL